MLEEEIRQFIKTRTVAWAGQHCVAEILGTMGHGKASGAGGNAGPAGGGAGGGGAGGGGGGGGFPPFPPFGPWGSFPWNVFRRARAKRGDVRAAILSLLAEKPLNGYQIMQELEQRSRGSWRPSPGAVYPALQQLEDEGLVKAESLSGGRVYNLSESGRVYVQAHPDEFAAPWETGNQPACDDNVLGLFAELKHIATATLQVVHAGSSIQTREAQKILNQSRRSLYRLLADDPDEDEGE
jgi:DNA-binding PadR family transcriptional regulator